MLIAKGDVEAMALAIDQIHTHAVFLESAQATDGIMHMVRRRAGLVPIVDFILGTGPRYGPEYENSLLEFSRRHDRMILNEVERAVPEKEREKSVVWAGDGAHWIALGHRLAGQALASEIQRVFPSKLRRHHNLKILISESMREFCL